MLHLPAELQEQFREDIHRYEEEKRMPYMSSIERMAHDEGLWEGLLEGIAMDLKERFGRTGLKLLASAREITNVQALRKVARVVKHAKTLDEIRSHLT